jgi:hypothetical protein
VWQGAVGAALVLLAGCGAAAAPTKAGGGGWTGTTGAGGAGCTGEASTFLVTGDLAECALACDGGTIWVRSDSTADGGATPAAWSLRLGAGSDDFVMGLAVAPDGTLLLATHLAVGVDFGGGPVAVPPSCPNFVSAYAPTGEHRWSRSVSRPIVGLRAMTDGSPLLAFEGGDVAGLAPDGTARWLRGALSNETQIAVGGDGFFLQAAPGSASTFNSIEKLSAAGEAGPNLWLPDAAYPILAASPRGELFFGLALSGPTMIGDQIVTAPATAQASFAIGKLDASATLIWLKVFGTYGSSALAALVPSADGSLVLQVGTSGIIDFGGGPLDAAGIWTSMLARLDGDGGYLAATAGVPEVGYVAAELPSGELAVADNFSGSVDLGGSTVHTGALNDQDFLVAEVSSAFALERYWHFGNGGGDQRIDALATDPGGGLVMAGSFQGKLDLGSGVLRSAGGYDVFLARMQP